MIAVESFTLSAEATPALEPQLDRWADRFGAVIAPPPPARTFEAFVQTMRSGEGKTREERQRLISVAEHAPQLYTVRAFDSGRYLVLITIGPAQDGKSLITVNLPIAYVIIELQQHVAYGGPDRQKLNTLWRQKLRRLIVASGYGHLLPKEGPGSGGGAADDIQFSNGSVMFIIGGGSSSESAQSAVTAQWAFIEERDGVREHIIELILSRTAGQGMDYRHVMTSTIKKDRGSKTVAAYDESTRCAVEFACAFCGQLQLLSWAHVVGEWENGKRARETVRYKCPSCGELHTPEQHARRLSRHREVSLALDGSVLPEKPALDAYGMRWSALDSPRKGLEYLATKYSRAWLQREKHFNHEPMRQFYRDELTLGYLEEDVSFGGEINDKLLGDLAARATYQRGEVPGEAELLVVGADCQLRSHYHLVLAVRWLPEVQRLRWWIVDWGHLSVCGAADMPRVDQRHQVLDQVEALAETGYPQQGGNGRRLPAAIAAIDTAVYPSEVRPWIASRGRPRWLAMRGCGSDQFGRMGREPRRGSAYASVKNAVIVYEQDDAPDRFQAFAEASTLNDLIESDLQTGEGMIPKDADNQLAFHLRGIARDAEREGRPWRQVHRRHDFRDCLVYALARALFHFHFLPTATRAYGVIGNMIRR